MLVATIPKRCFSGDVETCLWTLERDLYTSHAHNFPLSDEPQKLSLSLRSGRPKFTITTRPKASTLPCKETDRQDENILPSYVQMPKREAGQIFLLFRDCLWSSDSAPCDFLEQHDLVTFMPRFVYITFSFWIYWGSRSGTGDTIG